MTRIYSTPPFFVGIRSGLPKSVTEGATVIYPLTDIRTRKGDNLERGYLQKRYGATPRHLRADTFARASEE